MDQKECSICHKLFTPKHFNQTRCPGPHYKNCPVCGKQMPWTEYNRCCSRECANIKRKTTCLEKYGEEYAQRSDAVQAKARETIHKRYGVDYPAQDPSIRAKQVATFDAHYGKHTNPEGFEQRQAKSKATCLERYGTEYSFQSDNNKQKSKATCLKKYGTEYAFQSEQIRSKCRDTCLKRYGVEYAMQAPEVIQSYKEKMIARYGVTSAFKLPQVREQIRQTNLEKYGVPWYCMTDECKESSGKIVSKLNKSFSDVLTDRHIEHKLEFHVETCSYDFKVGDILVELDPSFTHNCMFNPFDRSEPGLTKDYHLNKTKLAEKSGYRCIHVFDWDSWDKIISMLSTPSIVRYARKCTLKEVSEEECISFLSAHHLQGACKGQIVRLGLYDPTDGLVQLVTFGKPRYNRNYQWELLRLCTADRFAIVGGAQKLFKHFIEHVQPESIISYCDRSKFRGDVYTRLGFQFLQFSEPSKTWFKDGKHITDNLLRQHGYDHLFGTNYGKGVSNEQLMVEHYWWPIYDCGQYVFEWRKQ